MPQRASEGPTECSSALSQSHTPFPFLPCSSHTLPGCSWKHERTREYQSQALLEGGVRCASFQPHTSISPQGLLAPPTVELPTPAQCRMGSPRRPGPLCGQWSSSSFSSLGHISTPHTLCDLRTLCGCLALWVVSFSFFLSLKVNIILTLLLPFLLWLYYKQHLQLKP